jgi:hypothetical protein
MRRTFALVALTVLACFAILCLVRSAHAVECSVKNTRAMLGVATLECRAKPGYTGQNAFVIEATGRDALGTGTSVPTCNVNIR